MSAWLFARALSACFFVAFVSYGVQVRALIGGQGLLPAGRFAELLQSHYGLKRWVEIPTVFHLSASDGALVGACVAGALLSILAFAGIAQSICFLLMWVLYLSLINISQDFLSFQWDILLVEAGFLAIFLAPFWPAEWNPARAFFIAPQPAPLIRYLFMFLLFRLMISSGIVKLTSGDETWRDLTAMAFHYETQPIPNPLAWFMHQIPLWAQKISCVAMFAIELGAPFLLFIPGKARVAGAFLLAGLQVLIMTTGNYAYFNFLSIALCLWAIDDSWFSWAVPSLAEKLTLLESGPALVYLSYPLALVLGIFGSVWLVNAVLPAVGVRGKMSFLMRPLQGFHLSNPYGLFAVMTTERNEIVIEGSNDGNTWAEYEFKYKPGRLDRMPPVVAPHQPRLDWQMWFAALGPYERSPWFYNLLIRLLQNDPLVTALFAENPFPNVAPKQIRAVLYQYHFAPPGSKDWWIRLPRGEFSPTLALESPR